MDQDFVTYKTQLNNCSFKETTTCSTFIKFGKKVVESCDY